MTPGKSKASGRAIFLVGFMGAGKTSVGSRLAARLGWRFLDLDDVIEAREGRAVRDIFRDAGEAAFRRMESDALATLLDQDEAEPLVLALGGGAFVQPHNARTVKAAGAPVIFLDAPVEELRLRCAGQPERRPLFQDEAGFRALYESRRLAYLAADYSVATTGLSIEQVVEELLRVLERGKEDTQSQTASGNVPIRLKQDPNQD